jgi:hypothetical protein
VWQSFCNLASNSVSVGDYNTAIEKLKAIDVATLAVREYSQHSPHEQIVGALFSIIENGSIGADSIDTSLLGLFRYLIAQDDQFCDGLSHFSRALYHLRDRDAEKFEHVYEIAVTSIVTFGRVDELSPSECMVICMGSQLAHKNLIYASLDKAFSSMSLRQKEFVSKVGGSLALGWLENGGNKLVTDFKIDLEPLQNKRLNIAVLYSGRPLNLNAHLTSHMLGMMAISEQHNVHNFCVLWDQDRDFAGALTNLLRPVQMRVLPTPPIPEDITAVLDGLPEGKRQFTGGMLPMMVGMQGAFHAFESMCGDVGRTYDLVVRMRYDLAFGFKIQPYVLAHAIAGYLCLPSRYNYHGVNDQLGIGTPEMIGKYMSPITNLAGLCKTLPAVNPEMVMEAHLRKERVNRFHFDQDYRLIRHWQTHQPYDELSVHDEAAFSKSRRLGYVMHYE